MTGIDGKMGGTFELMGKMTGLSRWEIEGEKNIFIITLDSVAKLEYIPPILEEITLRRIVKSSVLSLAVWDCTNLRCFCESVPRLLARIVVQ